MGEVWEAEQLEPFNRRVALKIVRRSNAWLVQAFRIERETLAPFLYHYQGRDAVRHVFRVAASLDSMVVGEPQILGQLKAAYAAAKAEGVLNGELETVLTHAFSVAKRVRSDSCST